MSRAIAGVAALAVVVYIGASPRAQARTWKRHTSDKLGCSMPVPRGTTFEDKAWPGGWAGLRADHKGVELVAAAMLGKKNPAAIIEALGDRISGVERRRWKVKKTRKARGGWVWYNIARGVQGKRVAFAVYGIGRKGTYLFLLVTTRAGARRHRTAIARWTRGVKLHQASAAK